MNEPIDRPPGSRFLLNAYGRECYERGRQNMGASYEVALRVLIAEWHGMIKLAYEDGPIPGDEVGHASRWAAVELCAQQLLAFVTAGVK